MIKRLSLISLLLTFFLSAYSQSIVEEAPQSTHHKSLNLEILGAHFGTGVNFDMRLQKGRIDGLGYRVGIGGFSSASSFTLASVRSFSILTLPLEINYVVGKKRHGFIAGVGFIPGIVSITGDRPRIGDTEIEKKGFSLIGTHALVGYRLSPLNTGLHIQLHYNPMFTSELGRVEYLGLQIGMGFK